MLSADQSQRDEATVPTTTKRTSDNITTREQIKRAARLLFIRHGLEAVSYGDIAELVGTTRANLHYHFGNKAQLIAEVFEETYQEVNQRYERIWLEPKATFEQRLEHMWEDTQRRFFEFNEDEKGRTPWSLSARALYQHSNLPDSLHKGIAEMSKRFEENVAHATRLAIGSGELKPGTPVRDVVLIISNLFYFGSPITQFGGLRKLKEHYAAAKRLILGAYGVDTSREITFGE